MILDKYIVIEGRKNRYRMLDLKMRLVEREPKLSGNEIALRLKLDVPDTLFERPTIKAFLKIPDVPHPEVTTEVTNDIENIIKERTDLEMVVSIVPFEKPEAQKAYNEEY